MPTYSDAVASATAGATADTFDNIGTVTLRADALATIAVMFAGAPTTTTTAEAHSGQLRVQSDDMGYGNQIIFVGPYLGFGIVTNDNGVAANVDYLPLRWKNRKGGSAGNNRIVIDFSTNLPDPTGGTELAASVFYEAGSAVPAELLQAWAGLGISAMTSGYDTEANGAQTAVAADIAALEVPSWAKALTGYKAAALQDVSATAGEAISGFTANVSTFPNFTPQEYPIPAFSAMLGTPVGQQQNIDRVDYLPMYFPLPGVNGTITPTMNLNVANTGGVSSVASVAWLG